MLQTGQSGRHLGIELQFLGVWSPRSVSMEFRRTHTGSNISFKIYDNPVVRNGTNYADRWSNLLRVLTVHSEVGSS